MEEKFKFFFFLSTGKKGTRWQRLKVRPPKPAFFVIFLLNETKERQPGLTLETVLQSEGG